MSGSFAFRASFHPWRPFDPFIFLFYLLGIESAAWLNSVTRHFAGQFATGPLEALVKVDSMPPAVLHCHQLYCTVLDRAALHCTAIALSPYYTLLDWTPLNRATVYALLLLLLPEYVVRTVALRT
jgi:hypothetical protein